MSNGNDIVYEIPGSIYPELVIRENALVILNDAAADVNIETSRFFIRIEGERNETISTKCDSVGTWTISGKHRTGTNGDARIHLNKFLECIPASIQNAANLNYISSRPNFNATPESEKPAFLTFTIEEQVLDEAISGYVSPTPLDIKITVRSWDQNGDPLAHIPFSWIAIARTAIYLNP